MKFRIAALFYFHLFIVRRKEEGRMEEKKEAGFPIVVWIVVIGLAAVLVAAFMLFLK